MDMGVTATVAPIRLGAEQRAKARHLAHAYFRAGCIKHECCAICRGFGQTMHHPDYSKPALIIWLCGLCHWALHKDRSGRIQATVLAYPTTRNRAERDELRRHALELVSDIWENAMKKPRLVSGRFDTTTPRSRGALILKFYADGGVQAGTFAA